jgi:hypothetical protein
MTNERNWRTEINSADYFGHQKKALAVESRRPVIRRASDLVGPGIAASAVRVTDFNDILATFNGYFAAEAGADNAPTPDQAYVGVTTMDSEIGGAQVFYGMDDGGTYKRIFTRNPADSSAVYWGLWQADVNTDADWVAPTLLNGWVDIGGGYATTAYMRKDAIVRLKGVISNTVGNAVIFNLPVGFRPLERLTFAAASSSGVLEVGRVDVLTNGDVAFQGGGFTSNFSLSNVSFLAEA